MRIRRSRTILHWAALAGVMAVAAALPGCAGLSLLTHILEEPYPPAPEVHLGTRGDVRNPGAPVDGWTLLAERRDFEAQYVFLRQIDLEPRAGEPLLGYAIASAFLGDETEAEIAVRQALRIDPRAISIIVLEPRVHRRVQRLAGRCYEQQRCGPTIGGVLVLGTLHLVLGDVEAAYYATEISLYLGDRGPAVRALYRIVQASGPDIVSGPRRADMHIRVERRPEAPRRREVPVIPHTDPPGLDLRSTAPLESPEDVVPTEPEVYDAPRPGLQPSSTILDDPEAIPEPWSLQLPESTAPEPDQPVDYERLRDDIRGMSDAVGRFEQKLLGRIADSTSAY